MVFLAHSGLALTVPPVLFMPCVIHVLLIQNLCTGRFPRPDELLDINFKIETNRSYNLVDDYNKELIKNPYFKIIKCVSKDCFMHLDFQFNTEEAIWESKMVRIR